MKKKMKIAIAALVFLSAGWGVMTLAKPPGGGGGGGTQNCNRVVCAQCPEGFVLLKGVWPDCCNCVPAP